jgi:hypothetical protein
MRHGPRTTGFAGAAVGRGLALLALAVAPPQAPSQAQQVSPHRQIWMRSVKVAAEGGWTAAGLTVEKGDMLVAGVYGEAVTRLEGRSAAKVSPDGVDQKLPNLPAPAIAAGALIGRIGGGAPFKVGRFYRGLVPGSGALELRLNLDDRTAAAVRGRGWAFQVAVADSRDAPPPPPAPATKQPAQPPVQPPAGQPAAPGPGGSLPPSSPKAPGPSVFDSIPEADLSDPVYQGRPVVPEPPPFPRPIPKPGPHVDPTPPVAEAGLLERIWRWLLLFAGLAVSCAAGAKLWIDGREARLLRRTARLLGVSAELESKEGAPEEEDFAVRGPPVSIRARLEREVPGHG